MLGNFAICKGYKKIFFANCLRELNLTIKSIFIKNVAKSAFKGTSKKLVVKVPVKKKKAYKNGKNCTEEDE